MSIDYDIVNDEAKTHRYFGVSRGSGSFTIGYAYADERGRAAIAEWIGEQLAKGAQELRIVYSESVPEGYACEDEDDHEAT